MDAVIAQLVEQPPCKRQVVGSSPTCGSIFLLQNNLMSWEPELRERFKSDLRLHEQKASKNVCIFDVFFEWSKSATALAAPFFVRKWSNSKNVCLMWGGGSLADLEQRLPPPLFLFCFFSLCGKRIFKK